MSLEDADVAAVAAMLAALEACPAEKRMDTLAYAAKVLIERPDWLPLLASSDVKALKSRLVLVRWSPRRWVVVRLREATEAGGRTVFAGDVMYGPNSLADCEDAIRRTDTGA